MWQKFSRNYIGDFTVFLILLTESTFACFLLFLFGLSKIEFIIVIVFRYRKNDARLPGKPDIVLPKYKTVIFVNGCFWHGHEGCHYFVWPKNNAEFWKKKIGSNIERDAKNHALLAKLGWNVIVVWECELKRSTAEETLNLLVHCIVQRQSYGNSD